MAILLLSCQKDCPEPPDVICGIVIGKAQSVLTGASYAIIGSPEAPPYRYAIIPWNQYYEVQVGGWYCGRQGTHDPDDPGNPMGN